MSEFAISVENLSKQYRNGGPQGRFTYKPLGESPTQAVQTSFRRTAKLLHGQAYGTADLDETIWALKDGPFEMQRSAVPFADGSVAGESRISASRLRMGRAA